MTAAKVIDRPPRSGQLRKRVSFSAEATGYRVVSHEYPSGYFYTRSDTKRLVGHMSGTAFFGF